MASNIVTMTDADHNVAIHRSQGIIICSIWWSIKKFFDLKMKVVYQCPLNITNALCCPCWMLGLKKYENVLCITLRCNTIEKEVSITVLADGCRSPFIISAGTEKLPGVYTALISRSVLQNYTEELSRCNFVVMCRVVLNDNDLKEMDYPNPNCSCGRLTEDLETLFTSQKFTDVQLIKGQKAFPAHKCFLSARSAILRKAFESKKLADQDYFFLEYDDSIPDEAVVEVLRYMYTARTFPLNLDLAVGLFYLADALELSKLADRCMKFILSNISTLNFQRIYAFALAIKSKHLEREAEKFFRINKRDVMKECYSDDSETMVRPPWIKAQEYLIVDAALKRLAKSMLSTKFFDFD